MSSISWQNVLSFCLILAILLTLFVLATPVFAADDSASVESVSVSSTSDSPLLRASSPPTMHGDSSTPVYLIPTEKLLYARGYYQYVAAPHGEQLYAFCYSTSSRAYLVTCSPSDTEFYDILYLSLNATIDDAPEVTNSRTLVNFDSVSELYYDSLDWNGMTDVYLRPFSSLAEGLAYVRSVIDSPPITASSFSYSLPPGNVAYIPIASGQSSAITYTLTTTYYMAFGNNDTSRINQVVTVMSSLPSTSNNLAPASPKIPWTNNGNVNLLGVSANKIYQGSIPTNYGGQYLVVVNPLTMPSQSGSIGGDTYTNGSINITVSAVSGAPYIYPMSESLTISPGDGIGSESSYGDSAFTYEVDPETGEVIWTDPYGGSTAPVAGGNNPMPSPSTIFDWLRNISLQIADFLRGPVQAVQVVISAIRDFMGSFTLLYQWLPGPVYSLITSALMVALTIGVIKIFV